MGGGALGLKPILSVSRAPPSLTKPTRLEVYEVFPE